MGNEGVNKGYLSVLVSLLLVGCALQKQSGAVPAAGGGDAVAGASVSAFAAFQASFFAFARTNCSSCHGANQTPLFAVADPNAAYQAANNSAYVSFTTPSSSLFAIRAGDGHCGIQNCVGNTAAATAAIQAWANAVNSAPSSGGSGSFKYMTTAVQIPANLPTGNTFVPIRWSLSQLNPAVASVSNAIFELEIEQLSATTYKLNNPRLGGNTAPVMIQGIHVMIAGSAGAAPGNENPESVTWANLSAAAQPFQLPNPLPTGPIGATSLSGLEMVLSVINPGNDVLTIGFDGIQ